MKRSGSVVITSTAWVPIDPVDPTRLTLIVGPPGRGLGAVPGGAGLSVPASGVGIGALGLADRLRPSPEVEHSDEVERRREDEEQGVHAVEHPPVSGQDRPHVLEPRSRFTSDSHRSPIGATTATTSPRRAALGTVQGWTCP